MFMESIYALWILLFISAITDLISGKIFNAITFPFFFLGIALQMYESGVHGLGQSLLAIATAFIVFFPLYLTRVFAAGDVKLLMAFAAWSDFKSVLAMAGLSIVFGALVGVLVLLFEKGMLRSTLGVMNHLQGKGSSSTKMPFAPALLCAFCVVQVAVQRGWSW
jgi:prepilin peptidase CpaA